MEETDSQHREVKTVLDGNDASDKRERRHPRFCRRDVFCKNNGVLAMKEHQEVMFHQRPSVGGNCMFAYRNRFGGVETTGPKAVGKHRTRVFNKE